MFTVAQQPGGTPAHEVKVRTERTVTATAGTLERSGSPPATGRKTRAGQTR
ncbi:hypothetical protein [Streptomyces marianii]|uniref:hypothetical protein n=1 Tax=Streptomyces marianii TaxID=1817406 RepID=UPI001485DFEA|nr:hypothetical protein [Streptomyces marianii]